MSSNLHAISSDSSAPSQPSSTDCFQNSKHVGELVDESTNIDGDGISTGVNTTVTATPEVGYALLFPPAIVSSSPLPELAQDLLLGEGEGTGVAHRTVKGGLSLLNFGSAVSLCSHDSLRASPIPPPKRTVSKTSRQEIQPIFKMENGDRDNDGSVHGDEEAHSCVSENQKRKESCRRCRLKRHAKIIAAAIEVVPFFKKPPLPPPSSCTSSPHTPSPQVPSIDDFTLTTLTGGLTNQLHLVRHKATQHAVVVRRYGKETGKIISRVSEEFWQSLFLKTYGRVGRHMLVYEFLDGHRTLSHTDLPIWRDVIAKRMAEMHAHATSVAVFRKTPQTGVAGIGAKGVMALAGGGGGGDGVTPASPSLPLLRTILFWRRKLIMVALGAKRQLPPAPSFPPPSQPTTTAAALAPSITLSLL